jgi:nucleoside-diphosphate-sugar epimerase
VGATRVLVLGGGRFVGRALVEDALARGWEVAALTMGRRPLPQGVRALVADRHDSSSLSLALRDCHPALVVDTWAGAPDAVMNSCDLLAGRGVRYAYVSTRSVYTNPGEARDEQAETVAPAPPGDVPTYPAAKRTAELAVLDIVGSASSLLLRPGVVIGPFENLGRAAWWLRRMAEGGDVLAPGPPHLPWQGTDVRDLATFTWDCLAAGTAGAVDVAPPTVTFYSFLESCAQVTNAAVHLHWADPEWLERQGIRPWRDYPMWDPPTSPSFGFLNCAASRAQSLGFSPRPLRQTLLDAWHSAATPEDLAAHPHGPSRNIERRLLQLWRTR